MMPNWEKEEDYKYTEKLTLEGWAWEFIRRNPKYQNDYHKVRETLKKRVIVKPDSTYAEYTLNFQAEMASLKENEGLLFFNPSRADGESCSQWLNRCCDMQPTIIGLDEFTASKWSLNSRLHNPSKKYTNKIKFKHSGYPKVLHWDSLDSYFLGDEENYAIITGKAVLGFDLSSEIKPQIESAQYYLKKCQDRLKEQNKVEINIKKKFKNTWLKYLRVLDAMYLSKAKHKEIAKVMFNHFESPLVL